MKHINPNQLWTQVPVASRTVEVNTKTGFTAAVSDKTGFSLTAGSYTVRASSCQRALAYMTSVASYAFTISAVTMTRTHVAYGGSAPPAGATDWSWDARCYLTSTTVVTCDRISSSSHTTSLNFSVLELF